MKVTQAQSQFRDKRVWRAWVRPARAMASAARRAVEAARDHPSMR